MRRSFHTVTFATALWLTGAFGVSAMSCAEAEDAFFEQYKSQSFAKNSEAFLADPMRWDTAAQRYTQGASLLMMAEGAGQKVSAKSISEFLVNAILVDCWRPAETSKHPRLAAMISYFDKQFPSGRREMLEAKARSLQ